MEVSEDHHVGDTQLVSLSLAFPDSSNLKSSVVLAKLCVTDATEFNSTKTQQRNESRWMKATTKKQIKTCHPHP